MKQFVAELRGFLKKLKELIASAGTQAGRGGADAQDKNDPFQQAADELGELEKALDRAFRDADAEPKVTDAPGARVSIVV